MEPARKQDRRAKPASVVSALAPYARIARPDHWFKNIFMLPGVVLALFFRPDHVHGLPWPSILLGVVSACLVASSNYVLNEILDAPRDTFHPEKRTRPIPSGKARVGVAYVEWGLLSVAGIGLGFLLNPQFGLMAALLWLAGAAYNVPPVRLKDLPYADVLSESLNNPLRLAMGWYATGLMLLPPLSIILAYWMFGAFLMAMKRYAEYRRIGDPEQAARYRSSFRYYNEERLIESIFFYGAFFGMLVGVFLARYHLEVVLASPLVAYAMAYYMHLGFKPNSPVQQPEHLFRQKKLMLLVGLAFAACTLLLAVQLPFFRDLVTATPLP
jgi:4-hydroxybenzoate polyprenyltransferase